MYYRQCLEAIQTELRSIRELLAWMKTDTTDSRARLRAEAEQQKADMVAYNESLLQRAAEQQIRIARQVESDHIAMFHAGNGRILN